MGHLIDFKGENQSMATDLNLLYQIPDSNIYIMDNHLAASWCWTQKVNQNLNYYLVHIDQHYDLNRSQYFTEFELLKEAFLENDISDLRTSTYEGPGGVISQSVIWDNFIYLFNKCFPTLINNHVFICTEPLEGNFFSQKEDLMCSTLSDLEDLNIQTEIIFNIDLDYFFTIQEEESNAINKVDDFRNKLDFLKDWYRNNKENIIVCTIALSPEFCNKVGVWHNSKEVLKEVLEAFEIEYDFDKIFNK